MSRGRRGALLRPAQLCHVELGKVKLTWGMECALSSEQWVERRGRGFQEAAQVVND